MRAILHVAAGFIDHYCGISITENKLVFVETTEQQKLNRALTQVLDNNSVSEGEAFQCLTAKAHLDFWCENFRSARRAWLSVWQMV